MATTTITLAQIEQWLRGKDADAVVCWDTFELWHGFMEQYFIDQGHANVRSEYARAMIDPKKSETGMKTPARVLANYEAEVSLFANCLSVLPLRYSPTAGALLTYLESGVWHNGPDHGQIPWYNPGLYNAHYDNPARPADVPWQHLDLVQIQGKTYRVYSSMQQPSYLRPGETIRSAEINIARNGWRDLDDLMCRVGSEQRPAQYTNFGHSISAQWIRADATVSDRNILTLETVKDVLGSWQRQGEILVKIA